MPKYLLRLRKTSFFLMFLSSAISFESNRAHSRAEATWHPIPPLKSLSDASFLRGSPFSMGVGGQAWGSGGWLSPLSTPLYDVWLVLCCYADLWVSSSWAGRDFPTSTTSFSFCFLFLFGSAGIRSGWQRRLRKRKRRFRRRRRKLWLYGFPRCTLSKLGFY